MKNKLLLLLRYAVFAVFILSLIPGAFLSADAAVSAKLQNEIIQSCIDGKSISISSYNITQEELDTIFWELSYTGKLPWYAGDGYRCQYNTETGYVVSFTPEPLDAQVYDRVLYEQKVAEIIASTVTAGMEDWQKALSVHDYLVARSAYDESLTYTTGYDLLVHGTSVCSGYAQAYMDIMNRVGVDCIYIVSEEMEHAWNLIRIAGSWYHADLTWNDPVPNNVGTVLHKYFLVSDAEMLSEGQEGHYGWETDISCTSEVLKGTFWKESDSQICYLNRYASFLRKNTEEGSVICSRDEFAGKQTVLYTLEEEYINIGAGQYAYPNEGLSMWNNRLYFSDTDTVYSMSLDGSDLLVEYTYDTAANKKFIYGSFVENDTLYLTLCDHDANLTSLEISLSPTDYHVHSYLSDIIPATCVEDGYTRYQCDCGISFQTEAVKASGMHTYETTTISDATPFKEGSRRFTCISCSYTYVEDIPKISFFKWVLDWIKGWFS